MNCILTFYACWMLNSGPSQVKSYTTFGTDGTHNCTTMLITRASTKGGGVVEALHLYRERHSVLHNKYTCTCSFPRLGCQKGVDIKNDHDDRRSSCLLLTLKYKAMTVCG